MKRTQDAQLINHFSSKMSGVFNLADLKVLFAERHPNQLYRRLSYLEDVGVLVRFVKGFFVTPEFNLQVLSQRICPKSYVSFSTILSEELAIGTAPKYRVDALKVGKTKVYTSGKYTIRQFGCSDALYFGFNVGGVQKAAPEKALLDTLYYYQHGMKLEFDIYSDIDGTRFDRKVLATYLKRYSNPRFRVFAQRIIDDITADR